MVPTPSLVLPFSLSLPHPHVSSRLCHPSCSLSRSLCLSLLSALPQPNRIPSTPIVASFRYAVSSLPSPSSTPTRLAVSISPRRTKLKGVPVVCSVLSHRGSAPAYPASSFLLRIRYRCRRPRALAIPRERIIIRLRTVHIVITGTRIHRIVLPTP